MQVQTQVHSSPLGDWRSTIARPEKQFVTLLWDVEGTVNYSRESILPSGHVELLFNLASDQYLLDPADFERRTRYDTVWVSGLQQRNIVVESAGYSHLIGIRFTPLGAWRFFGVPMEELRDRVIDADQVFGREMLRLRSRLLSLRRPIDRLNRLAEFVLGRIDDGPELYSGVVSAMDRIVAKRGGEPISKLVDLAGCSHRHLIRKFREQVGVGPKRFGEILRLQGAAEKLKRAPASNLADLALSSGYYDQAHFNRAFRKFAGASPRQFVASILPDEVTEAMIVD